MLLAVAWILVGLALGVAAYWGFVLSRIAVLLPSAPRVREGLDVPEPSTGWPLVSVIVPAHNEERVIESCARSVLASEYAPLEFIFVLDRCTDRTLELLKPFADRDARVRIVENGSCPPDWAGKCNAARIGAEAARGSYLLFTDADVQADPSLLRAAMGLAVRDRRALVSLLPTLSSDAWFERAVQPVAALFLVMMYPIDKVNREYRRRPFANGQFLLFERGAYDRAGGHVAVKDDLLEDIAFARVIDERGERVGLAIAEENLLVNMYPSFKAMRVGWKRIFIEACKRKVVRLREQAVRAMTIGVAMPLVQVLAVLAATRQGGAVLPWALAVFVVGFALQATTLGLVYAQSRAPLLSALFFPFGSAVVAKAMWDGARDLKSGRPVRWGGREYVLAPRD